MAAVRKPAHLAMQTCLRRTGQGGKNSRLMAGLHDGGSARAHNWLPQAAWLLVPDLLLAADAGPPDHVGHDHGHADGEQNEGCDGVHGSGSLRFRVNEPIRRPVRCAVEFGTHLRRGKAQTLSHAIDALDRHGSNQCFGLCALLTQQRGRILGSSTPLCPPIGLVPIKIVIDAPEATGDVENAAIEGHLSPLLLRGGRLAQDVPVDIRAEVFAANGASRSPFNSWAMLGGYPARTVEPVPHVLLLHTNGGCERGLASGDADGVFQRFHERQHTTVVLCGQTSVVCQKQAML